MKSIIFNANGGASHSARLSMALDLVRQLDAHLTIISAVPFNPVIGIDPSGAAYSAMLPVWREEMEKLRSQTEQDLANEDVSWDWVESSGPEAEAIRVRSALADLIITGALDPWPDSAPPSSIAGELAITAACPVLVLPEEPARIDLSKPALVAWDGSAEASHALRAALPILKKAQAVTLATVNEKKRAPSKYPPTQGGEYLSRHGIKPELVTLDRGKNDIASTLLNAAIVGGCGLIVLGAYGRMRISERILGGVTHSMLSKVQIPILLKH